MTIIESLNTSDIKRKEFNSLADELLTNLQNSANAGAINPISLINTYRSSISDLNETLFRNFSMKIYIGQYKRFSIEKDVLNRGCNLVKFSIEGFENAFKHEISILLLKYKENTLEGQLKLAGLKLLFNNFNLIDVYAINNKMILNAYMNNIANNINNILNNTQIIDLPVISGHKADFIVKTLNNTSIDLSKPHKAEHLTGLWHENMTRAQKTQAVMDYYSCAKTTAIRYMRKFDLYDNDEPKDYKSLYEDSLKEIEELKRQLAAKDEFINKMIG